MNWYLCNHDSVFPTVHDGLSHCTSGRSCDRARDATGTKSLAPSNNSSAASTPSNSVLEGGQQLLQHRSVVKELRQQFSPIHTPPPSPLSCSSGGRQSMLHHKNSKNSSSNSSKPSQHCCNQQISRSHCKQQEVLQRLQPPHHLPRQRVPAQGRPPTPSASEYPPMIVVQLSLA